MKIAVNMQVVRQNSIRDYIGIVFIFQHSKPLVNCVVSFGNLKKRNPTSAGKGYKVSGKSTAVLSLLPLYKAK